MRNMGRRVVGGLGGGLLMLSALLPFHARGSIMNENLETLSLVALKPWLGFAVIVIALVGIALAVSRNTVWLWGQLVGALACLAFGIWVFKPLDYGISLGVWTYLGSLTMLTISAAWPSRPPRE